MAQLALQLLGGDQAGFDVARIEPGFEQQKIDAAFDQRLGLLIVAVAQLLEAHVAAKSQRFGGRPDRSGDEAGLLGGGKLGSGFAGDVRRGDVQLTGLYRPSQTRPAQWASPESCWFQ